ncbi:MAG: hypothetical protein ACOYL9_07005 [Ilumatobacteraceae bacterium]
MSPPRWIIAAKGLLLALLVVGALFPTVGGFEGKGMAYRLPIFFAPALVAPAIWWRRRGTYPLGLDVALTLPFLLDTLANAVGLYDHVDRTDDVLHFVNWFILIGGITVALRTSDSARSSPRWLVWVAGTGIGAIAAVLWEAAEYAVAQSGVGGLSLTYGDTIADLLLSTTGGAVGALVAVRLVTRER